MRNLKTITAALAVTIAWVVSPAYAWESWQPKYILIFGIAWAGGTQTSTIPFDDLPACEDAFQTTKSRALQQIALFRPAVGGTPAFWHDCAPTKTPKLPS